jgi:hypothetical protein
MSLTDYRGRKMKRNLMPLLVAAFTLIGTVLAPADDMATTFGVGSRTCNIWTERRHSPTDTITEGFYLEWVNGFLSAVNNAIAPSEKIDILKKPSQGPDYKDLYIWIDNYCAANPRNSIAQAAKALSGDLIRRAQQAK